MVNAVTRARPPRAGRGPLLWIQALGLWATLLLLSACQAGQDPQGARFLHAEPQPNAHVWSSQVPVRLHFSQPVDRDTLLQAVDWSPRVPGSWRAEDDEGRIWRFCPDLPAWPRGTRVQWTVKPPLTERPYSWSFTISPTMVLYLWPPAGQISEIYGQAPPQDQTLWDHQRLVASELGILDFDVHPDGRFLYFSEANRQGGSNLIRFDLATGERTVLLACGSALCDRPRVGMSDDGLYLAFEYMPLAGQWSVVVLNLATLRTHDISPPKHTAYNPIWSPHGVLAFYDETDQTYRFWHPKRGLWANVASDRGDDGTWLRDGSFLFTRYQPVPPGKAYRDDVLAVQMVRFDPRTGVEESWSDEPLWEDLAPQADPTGRFLAFIRRGLEPETWTPGRQIWLRDLIRSTQAAITQDETYTHTDLAWSPDGRYLAYVRSSTLSENERPELWLYDVQTRSHTFLHAGAHHVRWLP